MFYDRMMACVFVPASAKARSNARRCSSTTLRPSMRLMTGVPSPSTIPASHLSILTRLRSALSQSVRHPPSLFFNARIFLPASVVAAPFTCACSDIVEREETREEVKERRWASWGMDVEAEVEEVWGVGEVVVGVVGDVGEGGSVDWVGQSSVSSSPSSSSPTEARRR